MLPVMQLISYWTSEVLEGRQLEPEEKNKIDYENGSLENDTVNISSYLKRPIKKTTQNTVIDSSSTPEQNQIRTEQFS